MNKFVSAISCILLIVSLLCSCSKSEKITNMIIIQGIGIDISKDFCSVTLQYLDVNKASGNNESSSGTIVKTANAKGKTINGALNSLSKTVSDELFYGQLKLIAVNEYAINKCQNELFNFFLEKNELRADAFVVIGLKSATEVICNSERGERVPAESVCKQLLLAEKKKICSICTVNDYIASIAEVKKPSVPRVKSQNDYCIVLKN